MAWVSSFAVLLASPSLVPSPAPGCKRRGWARDKASPTLLLAVDPMALLAHSSQRMLSRTCMLWMILLVCFLSCVTGEWLHVTTYCKLSLASGSGLRDYNCNLWPRKPYHSSRIWGTTSPPSASSLPPSLSLLRPHLIYPHMYYSLTCTTHHRATTNLPRSHHK